ncbi:hypothetical protein CIK06_09650 [Plantactinospora sp. KBS50]|nr:hypothetical protein CIK06_09650 [Plantactinospora sp. KBS50]
MSGPEALRRHQELLAAVAAGASAEPALAGLALLADLRGHLDRMERLLIEAAREDGASWSAVAAACGLSSRQAAEQRWLRLSAEPRAERARQREIDKTYGGSAAALRTAVTALHRSLHADPDWTERHPAARLARETLTSSTVAEPGARYDLARSAVADLAEIPPGQLPSPVAAALVRLRAALRAVLGPASRRKE